MIRSERRIAQLTWLLIAVGTLRLLLLILHDPMYGYANNYDFVRVSSWFDLWPDPEEAPADFNPLAQHPSAPISSYRVDPSITTEIKLFTSDLMFVWAALQLGGVGNRLLGKPADSFDLRVVGLVRALALIAAGAYITVRLRKRSTRAGLASAALFAMVLCDPVFSLLFNTLYSGFSTVLFSYIAGGLAVEWIAYGPPTTISTFLVFGVACLLLALAKVQYAALPLILTALVVSSTALLHRDRLRDSTVLIGLAVAAIGSISGALGQSHALEGGGYAWSMRMAAATDTYFGAALPSMADPQRGVTLLGLPARCASHVGKDWYSPGMQPPPCPEVESVPRWRLLRLVLHDPWMIVRATKVAVPLLQPFIVRYYGQVESGRREQVDLSVRSGVPSLGTWPEALPTTLFALLLATTVAAGFTALAELAWGAGKSIPSHDRLLPALTTVLVLVELYSFVTSWAGAGLIDLGRHSLLGQLAFLCLAVVAPLQLARGATRLTGRAVGKPRSNG